MMSSSESSLDEAMEKYKENIREVLNRSFPNRLPRDEENTRHLIRKQVPSTQLFPSCKFIPNFLNKIFWAYLPTNCKSF